VVTTNNGTAVRISWNLPHNGGSTILEYKIEIKQADNNYSVNENCLGSVPTIITNRYCDMPMQALIQTPYNLLQGISVIAKISSRNVNGWSEESTPNSTGALIQVSPLKPLNSPSKNSLTNKNQIVVDMTALVNPINGGSSITSYELQYDNGTGGITYTTLKGSISDPDLALTYTLTTVTQGNSYMVKYRGINIFGQGAFSDETTIMAGNIASQPSSPSVSYSGSNVRISWADSLDMGGLSVTAYIIKIKLKNGNYQENTTICNGADSIIKTNK
jgi:hypothetical protein